MAKQFVLTFGSGNPASFTGLSPTLSIFSSAPGGSLITAPSITEINATGFYTFAYDPTLPIIFLVDGGSNLQANDRYIKGILDPIQAVDAKVGFSFSTFGSTSIDPSTVLGYLKRNLEFEEGDSTFNKTTGEWVISSRGSSTILRDKTLTDSAGTVTKA